MKAFEYIENFFRIQFLCAFIILCLFLVHKKKKIKGFIEFSNKKKKKKLINKNKKNNKKIKL